MSFSLNAVSALTARRGQSGVDGLSPRIWDLVAEQLASPDNGRAPYFDVEDFLRFGGVDPGIGGSTDAQSAGFQVFTATATTASSVTQIAHKQGVVEMSAGGTAHHQVVIQAGGLTGATWDLPSPKGSARLRAFEAKVRVPSGTSTANQGAFVGVAAAGSAAANFLANTTMAVKDANLIGFHLQIGAAGEVHPVWRKSGSAVVDTVGSVATATPGEWLKLGFVFYHRHGSVEAVKFLVNNKVVASITRDAVDSTFPVNELMSPIVAVKTLNSNGAKLQVDFIGSASA